MPELSSEEHDWRSEGIFVGDSNIDDVCASFIRSIWRARERGHQVGEIGAICGFAEDLGFCVTRNVCKLFCYSSYTI